MELHAFKTVSSSNDTAIALLKKETATAPFIVIAEQQTQGRGRAGRRWKSLNGNLFASFVFQPNFSIGRYPQLAFVAGLAVIDALEHTQHLNMQELKLKWPNDVYYQGKKCGGVLIEVVEGSGSNHHVCIGVGLNLKQAPGIGIALETDMLPQEIAQHIGRSLLRRIVYLEQQNFTAIQQEWHQHALWLNQSISWRGHDGIFLGINDQGHAILKQDECVQTVRSGDIVSSSVDQ